VSRAAANQELDAIMTRAAADYPESNRDIRAAAYDFREEITGPVRTSLVALVAGAALLLVVAGINLAGLLSARTVQREKEIGIRRALGASRLRLWAQLVTENVTLACAGGLAGLAIAVMTLEAVVGIAPAGAWHPDRALSQGQVLLFTMAVALAMGFAVATLPAWRAASPSKPMLSHTRGASGSRAAARARAGVIGAQVALTVLLLVVAALVGTSLARVLGVDPGFAVSGRLIADVSLPQGRYDRESAVQLFETAVERARALPGVTGACAINELPLENRGGMTWVASGTTQMVPSTHKSVTAGCFDVVGVRLVRGRLPRTPEPEKIVLISESMARALWADGRDPVGQQVHMGLARGPQMTVAGVVTDIRNVSLERTAGNQVWMPHDLGYYTPGRLFLSAAVPPASLAAPLRGILRDLDPELALANVRTMDDVVGKATAPRRFVLWLLGGFAAIALLLSAVGIYGVLAHVVSQRAQEIGIRRALGATTGHITRIVGGTVGAAIAAGAVAGLAAAWGVSSIVASLLYEMSATDPRVYGAVALFVAAVALLAAWPPARRAARVEPMRALKD
jgi:predicted permease